MCTKENKEKIPYPKYDYKRKIPGVYKIEHSVTGKAYVGSTDDLGARKITNMSSLRHNKHKNKNLQEAYNKDSNIEFKVVALTKDREEAFDIEQETLDKYKNTNSLFNIAGNARASMIGRTHSQDHKDKLSYVSRNRVDSPETTERKRKSHQGKKHSEEHKEKIRQAVNTPEFKAMVSKVNTGRKLTEEQKKKVSDFFKGGSLSEEHKEKIREGHKKYAKSIMIKGIVYPSIKAAARILNVNHGSISLKLKLGKDIDYVYLNESKEIIHNI